MISIRGRWYIEVSSEDSIGVVVTVLDCSYRNPSNSIVIVELGSNPAPVIFTEVPTGPEVDQENDRVHQSRNCKRF